MSPATDGVLGLRRLIPCFIAALTIAAAGAGPAAAEPRAPWTFLEAVTKDPLIYVAPDRGPAGMGRVGEPFGAIQNTRDLAGAGAKMGLFSYANGRDLGVAAKPLVQFDPGQQLPPGLGFDDNGNIVGIPMAPFNQSLVVGAYFDPVEFGSVRFIAQIDFNIAPGVDAECAAELGGGAGGMGAPFPPAMPTTPVPPQTPTGNVPIGTTPPPGFGVKRFAARRSAAPRKLDQCDREALGMPLVSAQRLKGRKVSITTNAVPAGWSLRVAGAKRASKLRKSGAGRTVLSVKPGKQVNMRRRVTVKLPSSIKVVRGFWRHRGEKPIAGFAKDVMRPL
jgi:hypothetical protein